MIVPETAPSVQDRYFPDLTCFGCGPANDRGLRLKSVAVDDTVRATFAPWPEHDNGLGFLNGGIIATLLDCHSAAAMIVTADRAGVTWETALPYVTAGLDVRYLRPAPLHEPVELVARSAAADEKTITVEVGLWWQEKLRATGVATWKRWRPRPDAAPSPPVH